MFVGETGRAVRIVAGGVLALISAAILALALVSAWTVVRDDFMYPPSAVTRWKAMVIAVVVVGTVVPVVLWRLRRPSRVAGRVAIAVIAMGMTAVVGVWLAKAPIGLSSDDLSHTKWPPGTQPVVSWEGTTAGMGGILNNRLEERVVVLAVGGPADDSVDVVAEHLVGQGWDLEPTGTSGDSGWSGSHRSDWVKVVSRADYLEFETPWEDPAWLESVRQASDGEVVVMVSASTGVFG